MSAEELEAAFAMPAKAAAVLAVASPTSPAFLEGERLDRAWTAMQAMGVDPAHTCPECGQGWQYMGPDPMGHAQSFRHRCGNGHGVRRGFNVPTPSEKAPAPVAPPVVSIKVSKESGARLMAALPASSIVKPKGPRETCLPPALAELRARMRAGETVSLSELAEAMKGMKPKTL